MMTVRLVELHRVLKDTGSLYLHCDPTASHYLKVILDTIFGPRNFRNEIVWKRSQPKGHATTRFSRSHDVILFYSKSEGAYFRQQHVEHDPGYVEKFYRYEEPGTGRRYRLDNLANPNKNRPNLTYEFPPGSGVVRVWRWTKDRMMKAWNEGRVIVPREGGVAAYKRYLDEMPGSLVTDIWDDIEHLHGSNMERLGYDTQKPLALLERIIAASSNEGDVVLDPFCGCGTAVVAAQKLGRRWIGIDITYLAINVMNRRLKDSFGLEPDRDYQIVGRPRDVAGAGALARRDRYQFQWWALDLVDAQPREPDRKKGADAGVDGVISFVDDRKGKAGRVVVQVKRGNVSVRDIRDLKGVIGDRDMGLFITLQPPTEPMRVEAASAGFHHSELWDREFPRLQIITIEQLLNGERPDLPPKGGLSDFAKASRIREPVRQLDMGEA